MADFDKERVLERVRKMMAIANDKAATEGERDNAIRMAHATLAKHNLSMAEAVAAGTGKGEARESNALETRDLPWTRRVAQGIAELFFCAHFVVRTRNGKAKHYFVGRTSNVITAMEICAYVVNSITREGNVLGRINEKNTGTPIHVFRHGFAKGAADQVWLRCRLLRADAEKVDEQHPSTGTSIVLASLYQQESNDNARYIEQELGVKLVKLTNRERAAGEGYGAGREYGKGVSLNRQVGTATHKQLKGAQQHE